MEKQPEKKNMDVRYSVRVYPEERDSLIKIGSAAVRKCLRRLIKRKAQG